jgi:hypothetical protein
MFTPSTAARSSGICTASQFLNSFGLVDIEALRYRTRAAEGAGEGTSHDSKHDSLGSAARFGNRQITLRTEDALSDLAKIRVADKVVQIDRAVTQEIERLSSAQSILVVGDPGAGKSGSLSFSVDDHTERGAGGR